MTYFFMSISFRLLLNDVTIKQTKMKKVILAAIAVFAFGFSNAQDVKFGAKAALNVANLTGDIEDNSSLIGFQVGAFAEFKFSEKFSFQPELLYSTQGAKTSYSEVYIEELRGDSFARAEVDTSSNGYSENYSDTYKLSYLSIPLMLKYYFTPNFNVEIGPQIAFLLSAKNDYTYENNEGQSESGSQDMKEYTNSMDFSLNFGLGYNITENIGAGLRYNLGLSNVSDNEEGDDYTMKNSVFSVSVGYKF